MSMTGSFDDEGIVVFTPTEKKPVDPKRFQAAMFMDRADLWKKAGAKHPTPYDPAQLTLFAYKLVRDVALVYIQTPIRDVLLKNGSRANHPAFTSPDMLQLLPAVIKKENR